MYFIGVTTGKSSINAVFPLWAEQLELGDVALVGMDFAPHDEAERYRDAVAFIKEDPMSLGALVTTHKMDLFASCRDLFDAIDPVSETMGEISSLYKRSDRLHARTVDPLTSGLALASFLPEEHWDGSSAEAVILGAGGASLALSWHFLTRENEADRPERMVVTDCREDRLDHMRAVHATLGDSLPIEIEYHHCPEPDDNDAAINGLPPYSLVVNATGLGKDAPGSPVTDGVVFPCYGYLWEFNYRGHLEFLDQARSQQPIVTSRSKTAGPTSSTAGRG